MDHCINPKEMKRYLLLSLVFFSWTFYVLAQPGNVGINTITPAARIHVIRNAPSGGPLLTNAFAIFEDNQNSYHTSLAFKQC